MSNWIPDAVNAGAVLNAERGSKNQVIWDTENNALAFSQLLGAGKWLSWLFSVPLNTPNFDDTARYPLLSI
ncbi:hypothetical protein [Yersinia canariae]|uniref:hypothetical protein n=1 Tax=Yersinia canariae TaxID=2607663 RepID=UPI00119F74DB|nr:hypothetical protein [Yersinia canariae]